MTLQDWNTHVIVTQADFCEKQTKWIINIYVICVIWENLKLSFEPERIFDERCNIRARDA
jgi:hypothetical protein